jgi:multiple sugar transport system substrate-binding protein
MLEKLSRRDLLRVAAVGVGATLMTACAPKVIRETVVVEKEVEKLVKETVVVKEAVEVEKEVTRVVEKEKAVVPVAGPVVLRLHVRAGAAAKPSGSEWPILLDRREEFNAENPNITVELDEIPTAQQADFMAKMFTMIASGTVGDITFTSSTNEDHQRMAGMGALAQLEEFVESQNVDLTEYLPAAIGGASLEGHLYGMPFTMHSGQGSILIYNKTQFESEGIPLPGDDSTNDDLREWALVFTDPAEKVYGYRPSVTGMPSYQTWLRMFGGYYLSEDGKQCTINSPEGVAYAQWMHGIYQRDKVAPLEADLPSGGLDAMFAAEKVMMMQNGPWAVNTAALAVGDKFEVAIEPFPKGPSGVRGYGGFVNSWAVMQQSKHKPEAFKAAHALADYRAGLLRYSLREGLTAIPSVYDDPLFADKPRAQIIKRTVLNCITHRTTWNYRILELVSVLDNEYALMWLGRQEPTQQFLDNVAQKAQMVLDKEVAR